jgi:hypothetical protein
MKQLFAIAFSVWSILPIAAQCDATRPPIVFMHGFLASGDSYAAQIQRLVEKGYCQNRLFVFDWNSVSGNGKKTDSLLKVFIDSVLKISGAAQLDLIGHSAGGNLGRGLIMDSVYASKVAHYIHLGSRKWFYEYSWFPNRKCLNIYSSADMVMGKMAGDVEGAVNLDLKNKDHYEVATSEETFDAIYRFINEDNKFPVIPTRQPSTIVEAGGKAVFLGDNTPMVHAKVSIYKVDEKNGRRKSENPEAAFRVNEEGSWGPFPARVNAYYEIELKPAEENGRIISYFFQPFIKPDLHIYLRGFPQGNMIGMMLGTLPAKEDQSLMVIYSSSKAMIAGRDSVTVNGVAVTSPALTPASKTMISDFIFDDGDGLTSGKELQQFRSAPFLGGTDIYLPANEKSIHTVYYNGKKINLPAVPSKEKIMLAVF